MMEHAPKPRTVKPRSPVVEAHFEPIVQPMNVASSANVPAVPVTPLQPIQAQFPELTMAAIDKLGADAMKKSTATAERITGSARSGDIDELGKGLTGLIEQAREYDPGKWNKGILGKFLRMTQKQMDTKYRSVNDNVNTLVIQVDKQITLFRTRIGDLESLYTDNEVMYRELEEEADKGDEWIKHAEANLPDPGDGSDPFLVQKRADAESAVVFAKQRVSDLRRCMVLCQLQAPQIKQLAENSFMLIQKFGTAKSLTIPLLQKQYAQYVISMEQKKGAAIADAIDAETDRALLQNAASLRQNSAAIATSMARSVVTVETLSTVYKELEAGLQEVQQIRKDMIARLDSDAPKIAQLSRDLNKVQLNGTR